MGLYDRDYAQERYQSQFRHAPQMRMTFPRLTPAVKWLLIINFVVYFIQLLGADRPLVAWFSVFPVSWLVIFQLWRLVTYQFLHGGLWHILGNMIGLYFLGPTLERHWGSKKFLTFYLGCGAAGALFYILLAAIGFLSIGPMIGASGAILGMLAACAILFPHFVVLFLFFPIPIRVAAFICIFIAMAIILSKGWNAGGEAAHLGGMAAGALYVISQPLRAYTKLKVRSAKWEKKITTQQDLQTQVDQILHKVHKSGVHSLSSKEKRILKKATQAEQTRNQ